MSPSDHDDAMQRLAGEYVLGTLSHDERVDIERRLAHEPELRSAVAAWEARLLPLTAVADPIAPSPHLWERLRRELALRAESGADAQAREGIVDETNASSANGSSPRSSRIDTSRNDRHRARWGALRRRWNDLRFWRITSGLAFAAVLALSVLLALRPLPDASTPRFVVVLAAPNKSPGWLVQSGATATSRVSLIPLDRSTALPGDKSLQFWTKGKGWQAPVSLGLIEPGRTVQIPWRDLPPLENDQLFEITLEPPAGSPLNRPTGPVLYIGHAIRVT